MQALLTKDSLKKMLVDATPEMRERIIGRALVVLFNHQTAAEQNSNTTNVDNGVGFASNDANSGSKTAKYFLRHNSLAQWQVEMWMRPGKAGYPRICKYHAQLNEAAKAKAAAKQPEQEAADPLVLLQTRYNNFVARQQQ
jgi:hypothetical protein